MDNKKSVVNYYPISCSVNLIAVIRKLPQVLVEKDRIEISNGLTKECEQKYIQILQQYCEVSIVRTFVVVLIYISKNFYFICDNNNIYLIKNEAK